MLPFHSKEPVIQAAVVPLVVALNSRADPERDQTAVHLAKESDDFCAQVPLNTIRSEIYLDQPDVQQYYSKSITT